jgi:predicted esterase YcpF (UPF0227 family)
MNQTKYLYLHGFASSPHSTKAEFLRDCFQKQGISIEIPDLNGENFSALTLSRQIEQVMRSWPSDTAVTLIGSSLGGLTAAWLAEKWLGVQRLVLLAPAFGFRSLWLEQLGAATVRHWETSRRLQVYHYGYQRLLPLDYGFIDDLHNYREQALTRPIPTLLLHGRADEVIPISQSLEYACSRPWVKLLELESDHGLINALPRIWTEIQQFLAI